MNLTTYFETLKEKSPHVQFRDSVLAGCGVTKATFYIWVKHPEKTPHAARVIISQITGRDINEMFTSHEIN